MDFSAYADAGNDREVLRWVTDQIMDEVMRLSGQEYVDAYGASVKAALAAGEPAPPSATARGEGQRVPPVPAGQPMTEAEPRVRRRARGGGQPDLVSVDPSGKVDVEHGGGRGKGIYWVLRHVVLGPMVTKIFRPISRAPSTCPRPARRSWPATTSRSPTGCSCRLALDRRVTFVAKSDYFTGVGVKGWAQKRFFAGTGQVPIDRSGGGPVRARCGPGSRCCGRGELFGIYPEGTRSHDGRLYKGRTGVARLALLARVPVIPSAVIGTDVIAPPGKIVTRIVSPTVRFGPPLDFSRYAGMSEDRFILRSITDEIMYAIMELSGQEYVDLYAPAAKEAAAREAKAAEAPQNRPRPERHRRVRHGEVAALGQPIETTSGQP